MDIIFLLKSSVVKSLDVLFGTQFHADDISIQPTRKEFTGDFTVVIFPLAKKLGKSPMEIGNALGEYLTKDDPIINGFQMVQGFLNLSLEDSVWVDFLDYFAKTKSFGHQDPDGETVLVEFASPNTNKPLHLGHIRNILLGWSSAMILEASGKTVKRIQIVNDRGIAICKSMLAWSKFAAGASPESTSTKADHFVGDYYVLFEQEFQKEYSTWKSSPEGQQIHSQQKKADQTEDAFFAAYKNTYFNEYSVLGREARELLLDWENGEANARALWNKMNGWVYQGFEQTYKDLGVTFDKLYYESNTYLLGKEIIEDGLKKGVFYKKDDGSVWIDLTDVGLDHKLVLRKDGTSVYITQDIGTARIRYQEYQAKQMVYVVADEQNYHFQVLFAIMKKLQEPYANGLHHLSYGMVDLPTGKMKSREGTVVDADDLMAEVIEEAKVISEERSDLNAMPTAERDEIIRKIGMAALKFHLIKVNPGKRMTFDPKESVDMQGQTGPYIQNAYVRIQSILRKAIDLPSIASEGAIELNELEKELLSLVHQYPGLIVEAANQLDPSLIANFNYALAKSFHRYYHDHSILQAEGATRTMRLLLIAGLANVMRDGMNLLGIEMPERM